MSNDISEYMNDLWTNSIRNMSTYLY